MGEFATIGGRRYFPFAALQDNVAASGLEADEENRQSFVSDRTLLLDRTCGVIVPVLGRDLLFVIDRRTVAPGSDEWRFIGAIAQHLFDCAAALDAQGQSALASLSAVVFSTSPARAFADVQADCFVYDVDEFRRQDGSFVEISYAASNIVHDANHIWMFERGQAYTGEDAEKTCWQLQIDNAAALGLTAWDANFLSGLIARPAQVAARINSDPMPKLACSQLGKCSVANA